MQSICCILGAGFSHVAGVPLTRDLFEIRDVAIPSKGAARRFRAVWHNYDAWLSHHPLRNAEEYLADLLKGHKSTIWTVNERYSLRELTLQGAIPVHDVQTSLPFEFHPLPARLIPPFKCAVELVGAVLATPLPSDNVRVNFRYGARITSPLHCDAHSAFWREITRKADRLAIITTNYDLLVERGLRHKPMVRTFGPGCYYGGISRPQWLRGTLQVGTYRDVNLELDGAVPIYKLHGSLNWSVASGALEFFQDLRSAFRRGGDAAVIPPVPEKEIPSWLLPVWEGAEEELSRAETWVVCGYSLPLYDQAVTQMLRRASTAGPLERIIIIDPQATDLCARYSVIAPTAEVKLLPGLPGALNELGRALSAGHVVQNAWNKQKNLETDVKSPSISLGFADDRDGG